MPNEVTFPASNNGVGLTEDVYRQRYITPRIDHQLCFRHTVYSATGFMLFRHYGSKDSVSIIVASVWKARKSSTWIGWTINVSGLMQKVLDGVSARFIESPRTSLES